MNDRNDWFAGIFIAIIIGMALGYAYRYGQERSIQERSYEAAAEELSVVVKGEICR